MTSRYDTTGLTDVATRGEDPRIAAAIHAALGDVRTLLNVGAGAGSYWRRPEAYLDPAVRANVSVFALLPEAEVDALRADLDSGAWARRNAELLGLDALDLGYRILVAE